MVEMVVSKQTFLSLFFLADFSATLPLQKRNADGDFKDDCEGLGIIILKISPVVASRFVAFVC